MNITNLHKLTQEAINAIGNKQTLLAKEKINEASSLLDTLIDTSFNDDDLVEFSKYQALIKLLKTKLK